MNQQTLQAVGKVRNGRVKLVVRMLDKPVHTKANGYRCRDKTCICRAKDKGSR